MKNLMLNTLWTLCLTTGCASVPQEKGVFLTPEVVDQYGTQELGAPLARTIEAAEEVLLKAGYRIATRKLAASSGLIITEVRDLASYGVSRTQYSGYRGSGNAATAMAMLERGRLYTLEFSKVPKGTRVRATPSAFVNGQDLSKQEVWVIDGPVGEKLLWEGFFHDLRMLLSLK